MPTSSTTSNAPTRFIVEQPGFDTEYGIKGLGYSPDNGKTFIVQDTTDGRVYHVLDAQRLAPLLKPFVMPWLDTVTKSLHWADILDKPDLATKDDLKKIELTPGPPGPSGKDGHDGQPGRDGKDGKNGQDGITPHIGNDGNWFIGDKDTGIKAQGPAGKDGHSTTTGGGGDSSLSIEAITDLIKDHLSANVDTTTGQLTVSVDDTDDGSIADAVAAKVAASMTWKLASDGELVAQMGGA